MVNAGRLLADLKRLRRKLDDDLRRHHAASPGRAAVEAEWRNARKTRRTADTFETFFGAAVDQFTLAAGDSLLHGRHFFRRELGGGEDFRRRLRHHYAAEDTGALHAILGRQYHAVVGNPPYITPKDPAMRDAYREIYRSCHMKYGLGAPFTERFLDPPVQQGEAGGPQPAGDRREAPAGAGERNGAAGDRRGVRPGHAAAGASRTTRGS